MNAGGEHRTALIALPESKGLAVLGTRDPTSRYALLDHVAFRPNQLVVYRADVMHSAALTPNASQRLGAAGRFQNLRLRRLMHQIFYAPDPPRSK